MQRDAFFAMGTGEILQQRLEDAEQALKTVRQAGRVTTLKSAEALAMPIMPGQTVAVLGSTVANIDSSARSRLLSHFKRFDLRGNAEAWITYGVEHVHDDACPFCGRDDVDAEGMVSLYGQIFGEIYKAHLSAITETARLIDEELGPEARTRMAGRVAANAEIAVTWSDYVSSGANLPQAADLLERLETAHTLVKALFDRKRSDPLASIAATELDGVTAALAQARALLDSYNDAVSAFETATKKAQTSAAITEADAIRHRDDARKRAMRHDLGVQSRIDRYFWAKRRDDRARRVRTKVQKALKKANEDAAGHYHARVNHHLDRFGASFTISPITNSMHGNAGSADYALLIRGQEIARGRGRDDGTGPSFRNTLSAGDKATLAFAFFLAKLEHDADIAAKIVVIDDPLSSHDSHRRRETVRAIKALCGRCIQIIVLSHDEFLLRDIEQACSDVSSVAFQLELEGADRWSALKHVDLDDLCQEAHVQMVEEMAAFVDTRAGDPGSIFLKIRIVLETHYRRSFTAYFTRGRTLGGIVDDIRATGQNHPCHGDLERLDNCNGATRDKHHGDDARIIVNRDIDPDELAVIARDALELIGARKPSAPAQIIAVAQPAAAPTSLFSAMGGTAPSA